MQKRGENEPGGAAGGLSKVGGLQGMPSHRYAPNTARPHL